MSKVIALIPARGGSKSIPLKNIKILAGKPLIYWSLQAASNCSLINKVYVATEHSKIKSTTLNFKFSKVKIFNRNTINAQDTSSTESLLLEFINSNNLNENDILVLIQATSPFTTSKNLEEAINKFKKGRINSLLSVVEFKRFIWDSSGKPLNYNYNDRPRRQEFTGYYLENGAFYISKVKNILTNKNRLSEPIGLYLMPEYTSLELDEPQDWLIAEKFIK